MTGGILDVHAHDGILTAHALGAKADGVDAVFQQLFHLGSVGVLIVGADGTHQRLLGQQGSGLDGGAHAHAHQQGRTGVQAVAGHLIQHEVGNALVARAGHQHHGLAGQGAAAACHVGVNFALVGIGNDVPPDSGRTLAHILLGVVLVEGLHGVVAQGRGEGSLDNGFLQQGFQLVNVGEIGAAFQPELDNAGVLAAGAVQRHRQILIAGHGFVQNLGQGIGFLFAQLLKLGNHVVGQLLADVAHKVGDHIGQSLDIFFLIHKNSLHFMLAD